MAMLENSMAQRLGTTEGQRQCECESRRALKVESGRGPSTAQLMAAQPDSRYHRFDTNWIRRRKLES